MSQYTVIFQDASLNSKQNDAMFCILGTEYLIISQLHEFLGELMRNRLIRLVSSWVTVDQSRTLLRFSHISVY
jgi:hypothetical protein